MQDRARREALYCEFIREASTLFRDAFRHETRRPGQAGGALCHRETIRLFGEPDTLQEAERVMQRIGRDLLRPEQGSRPPSRTSATVAASTRSARSQPFAAGNWQSPAVEAQ